MPVVSKQIKLVGIDEVKPDSRNARLHPERNLETIKTSLRVYGQRKPIVVNKRTGIIEAGNGLWQAAKDLGWEKIAVVYVDDDPATATGYAIMDNRSAELAEWDEEILGDLLEELKLEEFDLDLTGFDDEALREILPPEPVNDDEAAAEMVDRAEELNEKWKVERGQIWEIPSKSVPGKAHRVMCGDSTGAGNVALLLAGAEPYLMVTDPPYGVNYDPNWRNEALSCADRRIGTVPNDNCADWGEVYALWPSKVLYAWSPPGDHLIATGQSILNAGFEIRAGLVWVKSNFVISRGHYNYQHEPCWYAVRKGATARWKGAKGETSVWRIGPDEAAPGGHSTQKPVECMARPIRNHDAPEVCDPFLGSGTTVVAAEQEGRICYGMEIEPKYVAVTLERLASLGLEPQLGERNAED